MRLKILQLALILSGLLIAGSAYAHTEFVCQIDPDNSAGTDYTKLSTWESAHDEDYNTTTAVLVFSHGGITGTISDKAGVVGETSGAKGTATHTTANQILIINITSEVAFQSGERVYSGDPDINSVTISDNGDSPIIVAEVMSSAGTDDAQAMGISGGTFDDSCVGYFEVRPKPGWEHSGVWDDSLYIITSNGGVISVSEPCTRINGIQIKLVVDNTGVQTVYQPLRTSSSNPEGTPDVRFTNNIVTMALNGTTTVPIAYSGIVISSDVDLAPVYVANNLVYNFRDDGENIGYAAADGNGTESSFWYNNTFVKNEKGFNCSHNFAVLKNNLIASSTIESFVLDPYHNDSQSNCIETNESASTTADFSSQTFTFVDANNGDWHLAATDAGARDKAADLTNDTIFPFSTDFEDDTRPYNSVWDCGADEYYVAATGGWSDAELRIKGGKTLNIKGGQTLIIK